MMPNKTVIERWMRGTGFPREFGLSRRIINSWAEFTDKWIEYNGRDIYMSVFSSAQIVDSLFDTIFFDIDTGKDGLNKYLSATNNIFSRVYFSGAKGYHIYIDLSEPIHGRDNYQRTVRDFVFEFGLENIVDRAVVGDIRRMARVPLSINTKTGAYMIEITPIDNIRLDRKFNIRVVSETKINHSKITPKKIFDETEYPQCIKNAIDIIIKTGELDHVERLTLAMFMILNNEEDKLRKILKYANDYRENYSNYQIDYIKRRELKIYKCENIPATICPFKNKRYCPYYPSLNIFFEKVIS